MKNPRKKQKKSKKTSPTKKERCVFCNGDGSRITGWGHRVICHFCKEIDDKKPTV